MINKLLKLNSFHLYAIKHKDKILFIIIGGINTIFGFAIFPLLYLLFQSLGISYIVIFIISYAIATLFSFTTNKIFVFQSRGNILPEYFKFMSFHMMHFFVNLTVLPILVEFFGISPIVAQPFFVVIVIITSYFWYSKVTFIN